MSAPACRCGHSAKEHAHGNGRCWSRAPYGTGDCRCTAFSVVQVRPRGTSDRCVRCNVTHALPDVALPWCAVEGRKGADHAS